MKVICAWCKKDLGEKCGKCGGTQIATILVTLLTPNKQTMPLFFLRIEEGKERYIPAQVFTCGNPACEFSWMGGMGQPSHGMCADCEKIQTAKAGN